MSTTMKFSVEKIDFQETPSDSQFATAKIRAFSSGISRNRTFSDGATIKKTAKTIESVPILYELDNRLGDFGSHTPKPLIAGFIAPDSSEIIEVDGVISVCATAKIWKRYSANFMDIFKEDEQNKRSVSVEMEVLESEPMDDGILNIKDLKYCGVAVLGSFVTPASPGADMQMLSFAKNNQDYQDAYILEFGHYEDLDFSIPGQVKEEVKKIFEKGEKGTAVALSLASHLLENEKIEPKKIKILAKYFLRNSKEKDEIGWSLRGGDFGANWAVSLFEKMEKIDRLKLASFEINKDMETVPDIKKEEEKQMADEKDEVLEKDMAETKDEKTETPAEEKAETPAEEKKEQEEGTEKKMSSDGMADVSAFLAMLKADTEQAKNEAMAWTEDMAQEIEMAVAEMEKSEGVNFEVIAKGMRAFCGKMAKEFAEKMAQKEVEMSEFSALKKFKEDFEKQNFEKEIVATLAEISGFVPAENMQALREDSANFSADNIDSWKNKVRAVAFTFAKNVKPGNETQKIGLPFTTEKPETSDKNSVWTRIN